MKIMFKSLKKPNNWEFLFRTPYIMKGPVYDQVGQKSINLEKVNIQEIQKLHLKPQIIEELSISDDIGWADLVS